MLVDCSKEFELRKRINQSRRLVKEMGFDNRVVVTVEPDKNLTLNHKIIMIDITTGDRLVVDPQRLSEYYEHQNLSNLSSA
jgi:hypothetical protein